MTLEEYIACLKSLRTAVADLHARMFTEGVDGAPWNLQTYGGDLIGIYATLPEMMKDVGGFDGASTAEVPAGLEDTSGPWRAAGHVRIRPACRPHVDPPSHLE